jgi:hypothetical protein
MCEKYHDVMAIKGGHRRLDLFIIRAFNPNWLEIQHNLFPSHQSSEHPELVARVFSINTNFGEERCVG